MIKEEKKGGVHTIHQDLCGVAESSPVVYITCTSIAQVLRIVDKSRSTGSHTHCQQLFGSTNVFCINESVFMAVIMLLWVA